MKAEQKKQGSELSIVEAGLPAIPGGQPVELKTAIYHKDKPIATRKKHWPAIYHAYSEIEQDCYTMKKNKPDRWKFRCRMVRYLLILAGLVVLILAYFSPALLFLLFTGGGIGAGVPAIIKASKGVP